jgi:hypothetical protein
LKTLQFPFKRDGFTHELLKRERLVCLVRRSKPEHWHYEVVRLRIEPGKERFGTFFPEHERYPSNEEWGTHGFTYLSSDLKRAEERWLELLADVLKFRQGDDSGPLNKVA